MTAASEKIESVYHNKAFYTEGWKAQESKVGHFEKLAFGEEGYRVDPFSQRPEVTQLPVAATEDPCK